MPAALVLGFAVCMFFLRVLMGEWSFFLFFFVMILDINNSQHFGFFSVFFLLSSCGLWFVLFYLSLQSSR
jgi:hypothetical protein